MMKIIFCKNWIGTRHNTPVQHCFSGHLLFFNCELLKNYPVPWQRLDLFVSFNVNFM